MAREVKNSRTTAKKISRHVFRSIEIENYGAQTALARTQAESCDYVLLSCAKHNINRSKI
ncbi:DUF1661 domain-containing protein [Porphyromonas gulae]|uniref:DUF1661 domain-containing protein n=1 Tax=Porphyromonas gulae TaxID=111105 RepID=UPI001376864F